MAVPRRFRNAKVPYVISGACTDAMARPATFALDRGVRLAHPGAMHATARSLIAGSAGAVVLTVIHEAGRRLIADAPRMDVLGVRALRRLERAPGWASAPALRRLSRANADTRHRAALAGDLVANSLYYAAIPARTAGETWTRAAVLGTAAGVGALMLPSPMGLGQPPHAGSLRNRVMTVAWYLAGALAAAAAARAVAGERQADL